MINYIVLNLSFRVEKLPFGNLSTEFLSSEDLSMQLISSYPCGLTAMRTTMPRWLMMWCLLGDGSQRICRVTDYCMSSKIRVVHTVLFLV